MIMHSFTQTIINEISKNLNVSGRDILEISPLLEYINRKTKSADSGSKSRGSFANLYAIYVLVEDYIRITKKENIEYSKYEGAKFTDLLTRQRELPFGTKLQNHALNHRLNEEFHKFFPTIEDHIIIRDIPTSRYWINKRFLFVKFGSKNYDISNIIISIINLYIKAKQDSFINFVSKCKELQNLPCKDTATIFNFICNLLEPNVDARLFEITSFSILKYYYWDKKVFWGYKKTELFEENLKLYKTGRTNANDGGIDFVMRPLGHFFQVTETLDVKKYFLDIDKVEHYPIKFVVKTTDGPDIVLKRLKKQAEDQFGIETIVKRYMNAIDEIINIPMLMLYLNEAKNRGYLNKILEEIILQSKIEFNYSENFD